MGRKEFSKPTLDAAWARSGGLCECGRVPMLKRPKGCKVELGPLTGVYGEHITPDWIGGDNSLDNCALLTKTCWSEKTSGYDRPTIDKTKREIRDHRFGANRMSNSPMPGSKRSGWRRPMNGPTQRR